MQAGRWTQAGEDLMRVSVGQVRISEGQVRVSGGGQMWISEGQVRVSGGADEDLRGVHEDRRGHVRKADEDLKGMV